MLRLLIVISVLGVAFVCSGWYAFFAAAISIGIIGAIVGPSKRRSESLSPEREWEWERVDRARRGESADPTRPDDHPLLLTHEIKRRR